MAKYVSFVEGGSYEKNSTNFAFYDNDGSWIGAVKFDDTEKQGVLQMWNVDNEIPIRLPEVENLKREFHNCGEDSDKAYDFLKKYFEDYGIWEGEDGFWCDKAQRHGIGMEFYVAGNGTNTIYIPCRYVDVSFFDFEKMTEAQRKQLV